MFRNKTYRFCPRCGGILKRKQIKHDEPDRLVCSHCGFVFYIDPKVSACVITEIDSCIVMLRRAIPPSVGKWVVPGGFVDAGETVTNAARREIWEEARLDVEIGPLVGVYSYPLVSVVVIVYEGTVKGGVLQAADESLEAGLFCPSEIPWTDIAFSSTCHALCDYLKRHYPDVSLPVNIGNFR